MKNFVKLQTVEYGKTTLGLPMLALLPQGKPAEILLMCGLHGDEIEGFFLWSKLLAKFKDDDRLSRIGFLHPVNHDSFATQQRWNINGVDLNRNFPTKNWSPVPIKPRYPPGPSAGSEVETKALCKFLGSVKPKFVLDFHSYVDSILLPALAKNDKLFVNAIADYGASLSVIVEYAEAGLGYDAPGGLHDWCPENSIQYLCVEVARGMSLDQVTSKYLQPTMDFILTLLGQLRNP